VPELQEEGIRVWEVITAKEATRAMSIHAVMDSAREATAAWERVASFVREANALATLTEREA
jgi:hypothetical protein